MTQLPWQSRYDRSGRRGWVIAACEPDRDAFNGHFTMALTEVLGDLAARRTDVTSRAPYIPLGTVADAVRRTTLKLADAHRVYRQYVTASRIELTDEAVVLPLFRNPAFGRQESAGSGVPGGRLSSFLDGAEHGSDLRHFVDSVAGSEGLRDEAGGLVGGFTGRAHELRRLSRWLAGDGTSPVSVVTGSPGAGKSALAGLLVCAAHRDLREPTRAVWDDVAASPPAVDRLAAAHAGGRGLEAVAGELGRQLGFGELSADRLLAALHAPDVPGPATLVIDAVDEADDVAAVCDWVIRAADGRTVRILVATRPYEESGGLRDLAHEAGHCFDLDAVEPAVLLRDLHAYVSGLLLGVPEYRGRHQTTGAFAGSLAETLVSHRGNGWGEFLVAGLYTRHFLGSFDPDRGADEAERLGAAAPRTLPEILDLDLAGPAAHPWLLTVLTALAHARGDGMPASVIQRVAAALHPEPGPSLADVQEALAAGHTYLRRAVDDDAVTVQRLFHTELVQHLRREKDAEPVLQALLDGLGPAGHRQWPAAEPYVLRHSLGHALGLKPVRRDAGDPGPDAGAGVAAAGAGAGAGAILGDPGYLLCAAESAYLPHLDGSLRRVVTRWHGAATSDRRLGLGLAAALEGRDDLARRVARLPGEEPLPWAPLWAGGADDAGGAGPVVGVLTRRGVLRVWEGQGLVPCTDGTAAARALAQGRLDGRPVLVVGTGQGGVTVLDHAEAVAGWPGQGAAVKALAVADRADGPLVVSGTSDGEVTVRELATGELMGPAVRLAGLAPGALAAVADREVVAVACATVGGRLQSWYQDGSQTPLPHSWSTPAPALSVAVGHCEGRLVLVAGCANGAVAVWDMRIHTRKRSLGGDHGAVNAVALGKLHSRCVVVAGCQDGSVTVWDLAGLKQVGEAIKVGRDPVRSLALIDARDGELHCLVGGDGPTTLWSLGARSLLRNYGQDGASHVALAGPDPAGAAPVRPAALPVTAVGLVSVAGEPVAVYGDDNGACHAVDARTGRPRRPPLAGDGAAVVGVEEIVLGGAPVLLLRSARGCRLWDVASGAHADRLPWPEPDRRPAGPELRTSFVGGALVSVHADPDGQVRVGEHALGQHRGAVTALLTTRLAGRPVAVSGGVDGTVRVWDLEGRRTLGVIDLGRPVVAVASSGDGLLLVGAGGRVYALEHVARRSPA